MKNEYIKSPLNYVGGKHKLLPQIIPLFPDDIGMFVDLFGGGCNVGVNVKSESICYNDIITQVVEMLDYFKSNDLELILEQIDAYIDKYSLTKTNQEGFLELRKFYNEENKSPVVLYTLICYAFNNQIRFNSKGEYNMPFGKDRSSFNPALRNKFITFVNELHNKDIKFTNNDFKYLDTNKLKQNDFIYCDPPYLDTVATYNENGGWNRGQEKVLLGKLIELDQSKIRWALSNNISINTDLKDWAEFNNFKIHYLNHTYSNCSYQKKDKENKDLEVLITNY